MQGPRGRVRWWVGVGGDAHGHLRSIVMDVRGLQTPPQPALWVQTSAFLTVPEPEQRPQLNFHLMALALPLYPLSGC